MTLLHDLTREIHRTHRESSRFLQAWAVREAPEKGPLWDAYDSALDRFYKAVADLRTHAATMAREQRRHREDYRRLRREIAEAVYTDRISPAEIAAAWGITEEEADR